MAPHDDFSASRTRSQTDLPHLPRLEQGDLRVLDGPQRGLTRIVARGTPLVVGSDPGCDLVLPDRRVSRRHVEVTLALSGFLIRDLDSRNGTWFEASRVREIAVPPGALIRVGQTLLLLAAPSDPPGLEPSSRRSFGELVGGSVRMRRLFTLLERAASSDVNVLLLGETGTGKDLAARAIHAESARARGPFEVFDCGAVNPGLALAALFGYVAGAFSGAGAGRAGVFEQAQGGTVFIDEIGELPLEVQAALLRVLETRTVQRVGGDRYLPVDVRVIAATHRDLAEAVASKRFREDLYYRLQVLTLTVPALRQRREDLPLLCARLLPDGVTLPDAELARLLQHDWPGNVRELRNVLEAALARARGRPCIEGLLVDAATSAATDDPRLSFQERKRLALEQFERRFLSELLDDCEGNIRRATRAAGMERTQLKRLLRKYQLI